MTRWASMPAAIPGAAGRWIERRADAYGRGLILALVFLTPVVVDRASIRPFVEIKVAVVWIVGLAAVVAMVSWSVERRVWPPRSRIALATAGFVAVCGLATAASISPVLSAVGSAERWAGLVSILVYALLVVSVVGLYWERPARLRHVAVAASAASLVVAVSVLLQATGVDRALWSGPVVGGLLDYPVATIGHPEFAGAYLGIVVPLLAYLALTARRRSAACLLTAAGAVNLVALWQTQSRSGLFAAAVGLAAMALVSRDRWPRWVRVGVVVVAVGAVVPVVLVAWHPGAESPPDRLAGLEVLRTRSLQTRLHIWGAAGRAVVHHPVLGTGPETFYASYTRYRSADPRLDDSVADKAHNIFLERATETGLVGLAAYLVPVILGLHYGSRQARRSRGPTRLLVAAFFGSFCGYLAQGLFSIDMPVLASLGWVTLGGIAALADPVVVARREGAPDRQVARPVGLAGRARSRPLLSPWFVHAPLVVGLCVAVAVGLRPLRAAVKVRAGQLPAAVALNPFDDTYHQRTGLTASRVALASVSGPETRRLFTAASDHYLQALRLRPGDIATMMLIARLESERAEALDPSRFTVAERWWRRVLSEAPSYRVQVAEGRRELQDAKDRTVERFQALSRLRPDDATTWRALAAAYRAVGDQAGAAAADGHLATLTAPAAGAGEHASEGPR